MTDDRDPPERARRRTPFSALYDRFYRLLRWAAPRLRGFYTVLGAYLSVGLGVALLGVWAFATLAASVMRGATLRFDDAVLLWMNAHASRTLTTAALEVTALGSTTVVWLVVLMASAFLWTSRHRYSVLLLWVAVMGGGALNLVLKDAFQRPRPALFEWRTSYAGHSSFPSGHAMTAMVLYWTLAYLIARLEAGTLLRRTTWAVAAVVVLLVGLSRVYLGVHYPSDVLAGFVIGFAWAMFCAAGIELIRYFRRRKPGVERQERGLGENDE